MGGDAEGEAGGVTFVSSRYPVLISTESLELVTAPASERQRVLFFDLAKRKGKYVSYLLLLNVKVCSKIFSWSRIEEDIVFNFRRDH